jgi:group I intron endonuclease
MLHSLDTSIYNLDSVLIKKSERHILCGIYRITNLSGNVYIGESKDILSRWIIYKRKDCTTQKRLYNSFISHSPENHTFEIIELCDFENLWERERFWQDHYINQGFVLGKSLMNHFLTQTDQKKRVITEEAREKHRKKMTGENNNMYGIHNGGEKHPLFGKKGKDNPKYGTGKIIQQKDMNNILLQEGRRRFFIDQGFSSSNINMCCNGQKKYYKNFKWEYKNECVEL